MFNKYFGMGDAEIEGILFKDISYSYAFSGGTKESPRYSGKVIVLGSDIERLAQLPFDRGLTIKITAGRRIITASGQRSAFEQDQVEIYIMNTLH